jgi:acetyl esterase/lipase
MRNGVIKNTIRLFALLSMASGILLSTRLLPPFGFLIWILKIVTALFSPVIAISGAVSALYGFIRKDIFSITAGLASFLLAARHIWRVSNTRPDLEAVFGSTWKEKIPSNLYPKMLTRSWSWARTGRLANESKAVVERDIPFAVIPHSERQLMCDVWQPLPDVERTETAVLYFHSSAWCLVDKDFGTRPLFSYLTRQGHVVMDVAYRLCYETDIAGMTADVFRAIAWMKANSGLYGVNPDRIILIGASAGGQIALLAAYARPDSNLIPDELNKQDLSVHAVVSYYGPPDMLTVRSHNQILTSTAVRALKVIGLGRPLSWAAARIFAIITGRSYTPLEEDLYQFLQTEDVIDEIMGGSPDQIPEQYQQVSPQNYIHAECPPTLLIHGEHDSLVPAASTRDFYQRLRQAGVPVVYLELPQTDHGFDLILSPYSPSMQASIYTLERFLSLLS